MQRRIISLYWNVAWKNKKLFWLAIISAPSTLILERFISPLAIAAIFQMIQNGTVTLHQVFWLLIGYAAIQFYTQIIGYRITLYASWKMQNYGTRHLSQMSFEHLMKKSARFYSDEFQGALVARAGRFSSAFDTFWSTFVYQVLFLVTTIIATMISVGIISLPYMLILLILTVLFMYAAYAGNKRMRPKFEARSEATSLITAQFSDSISNIMAVKAEAGSLREISRAREVNNDWGVADTKAMRSFLKFSSLFAAFIAVMKIAAIITAVMLVESHQVNAGVVYLLITFTVNLIEEIWNFNNFFRNYTVVLADAREMVTIIDRPNELTDRTDEPITVKRGEINLKNISFNHADQGDVLFKNFTLEVPAGQKIGLVGKSGSGKTTLVNLLLRFMDVDKGAILFDEQDITQVTQESLRQNIAFVSQDPLLFHRTIRENISYGRPDATKKEILNAAKQAYAWEFIKQLPQGLDTLVGERGVKLSGGQRQRIAIARAILKDAPILILDEATSALDSESEKLIQDALEKLMKNRTSIVIAHRLSTIAKLDRIIVLESGKIIEDGSHKNLLENKRTYATLWSHQSGGFIEE